MISLADGLPVPRSVSDRSSLDSPHNPRMARPPRINVAGVAQHVTQRGNDRRRCFVRESDRETYLDLLMKAGRSRSVHIHAYVLMNNHVHLLMTPQTPEGVSRLMQDVGRAYVRYFNRSQERTGTLWEGRFRSSLVDTENYILACYRYIELNPVRASLAPEPGAFPWSSYGHNARGINDPLITPHPVWLALGPDTSTRCRVYRTFFSHAMPERQIQEIRRRNRQGLPFGSEKFRSDIESKLGITFGTGRPGRRPEPR